MRESLTINARFRWFLPAVLAFMCGHIGAHAGSPLISGGAGGGGGVTATGVTENNVPKGTSTGNLQAGSCTDNAAGDRLCTNTTLTVDPASGDGEVRAASADGTISALESDNTGAMIKWNGNRRLLCGTSTCDLNVATTITGGTLTVDNSGGTNASYTESGVMRNSGITETWGCTNPGSGVCDVTADGSGTFAVNLTVDTNTLYCEAANDFCAIGATTRADASTKLQATSATDTGRIVVQNNSATQAQLTVYSTNGFVGTRSNHLFGIVSNDISRLQFAASGPATTDVGWDFQSTLNTGTCTLNGGSPSTCTATVRSGAICRCTSKGTTAAIAAQGCAWNVVTTTATFTSANGATNDVSYWCD